MAFTGGESNFKAPPSRGGSLQCAKATRNHEVPRASVVRSVYLRICVDVSEVDKEIALRRVVVNSYRPGEEFSLRGLERKHPGSTAASHGQDVVTIRLATVRSGPDRGLFWRPLDRLAGPDRGTTDRTGPD